MRLVVLTNILTPYRIPLFTTLQKHVDDFTVLLMARNEENRQWELGAHEFKTEILPGIHVKLPGYEVSRHLNFGVVRVLRRLNPDVVISGGFGPANVAASIYCRLFGKRLIGWGEISSGDLSERSVIKSALRRWLSRGSDGIIASSSDARDAFIKYGANPEKVLTCVMPFDVRGIHDKTMGFKGALECGALARRSSGPIILSIGQLIVRKGCRELFDIYERIVAHRPEVRLVVIGDGPERGRYEQLARDRGWQGVHFTGFVQPDNLYPYLALGDLFLFHTLFDPFGLVLSEAMAAELLVVSSIHASATRDLVEEGVTGFRIEPREIDSAAATVLRALDLEPARRRAIIEAAYTKVRQTDVEVSGEMMVRFARSLVAPEKQNRPDQKSGARMFSLPGHRDAL